MRDAPQYKQLTSFWGRTSAAGKHLSTAAMKVMDTELRSRSWGGIYCTIKIDSLTIWQKLPAVVKTGWGRWKQAHRAGHFIFISQSRRGSVSLMHWFYSAVSSVFYNGCHTRNVGFCDGQSVSPYPIMLSQSAKEQSMTSADGGWRKLLWKGDQPCICQTFRGAISLVLSTRCFLNSFNCSFSSGYMFLVREQKTRQAERDRGS